METNAQLTDDTFIQSQNRQEAILKNINKLQEMESNLYKQLESASASNADAEQQSSIVNKINELSTMRMTMFGELDSLFKSMQGRVSQTRVDLVDQMTVTGVMEQELNNAKYTLNALTTSKDNKMRMVEINTYYASKYREQAGFMKLVIAICIPLLILAIVAKKGFIPSKIANILFGIIAIVGGGLIIKRAINLSSRNNMDYDQFDWVWDSNASSPTVYEYDKEQILGTTNDIETDANSFATSLGIGCVGSSCCSSGTYYDEDKMECVGGTGKLDRPKTSYTEGFGTRRRSVSYVETVNPPCPFKSNMTVVKPFNDSQNNYVKVSTR
jgi:hypothetical protein